MTDFTFQENNIVKNRKVHINEDDTVSLFVFGEEEVELSSEAEKNAGVVPYEKVAKHHYADLQLYSGKSSVSPRYRLIKRRMTTPPWLPSL